MKKAIPLLPGQPGPRVTLAGVLAEQAGNLSTQADAADAAGDQKKAEELRERDEGTSQPGGRLPQRGRRSWRGARSAGNAPISHLNAGNQLMLRGQIADAIARYQESVAADPTFAEAHTQLAIAYERQGRDRRSRRRARQGGRSGQGAVEYSFAFFCIRRSHMKLTQSSFCSVSVHRLIAFPPVGTCCSLRLVIGPGAQRAAALDRGAGQRLVCQAALAGGRGFSAFDCHQ